MRISDIFTMGGGDGGYEDSCDCESGEYALNDPRLRQTGLKAIIGSRANGGSGLSAIFIEH